LEQADILLRKSNINSANFCKPQKWRSKSSTVDFTRKPVLCI